VNVTVAQSVLDAEVPYGDNYSTLRHNEVGRVVSIPSDPENITLQMTDYLMNTRRRDKRLKHLNRRTVKYTWLSLCTSVATIATRKDVCYMNVPCSVQHRMLFNAALVEHVKYSDMFLCLFSTRA